MQPEEVLEILVVDGGSSDGTQAIAEQHRNADRRVTLIDAAPVDPNWTGKAWGLQYGLRRADPNANWILCVDADASFAPELVRSLLNHAARTGISNFSLATEQKLASPGLALLHPALLTTLVYRFGLPGKSTNRVHDIQANGQCFFARRQTLIQTAAFETARHSLCEDITIARRLAECGNSVGFYEAAGLAEVGMYETAREAWDNWPRSLPMRDRYFGWRESLGLVEILLVQALPLLMVCLNAVLPLPRRILILNEALLITRLGVLFGVSRAYRRRPWTYWISPLLDIAAVLRIFISAHKRRQIWRNRIYVRRRSGEYELETART
jgi:dolichol-phosphate mannosyltransferase